MSGLRNIDCVNHPNQTTKWFPLERFATSPSTVMINMYFIANNATINKIIKIKRDTLTFGTRFFTCPKNMYIKYIFLYSYWTHIRIFTNAQAYFTPSTLLDQILVLWILCQAVFEQRDVFKQRDMYNVYKIKLVNGV